MAKQQQERRINLLGHVARVNEILSQLRAFHRTSHDLVAEATGGIKVGMSDEDLADIGFLFREMEELHEELRKEAKARKELAGKVLSERIHTRNLMSDNDELAPVRGQLATATCKMRIEGETPRKGTPEYSQLWEKLGLPKELEDSDIVKLSHDGLMDAVSNSLAAGKPLPGIVRKWPRYWAQYLRRS